MTQMTQIRSRALCPSFPRRREPSQCNWAELRPRTNPGTQSSTFRVDGWIPACAGMTSWEKYTDEQSEQ